MKNDFHSVSTVLYEFVMCILVTPNLESILEDGGGEIRSDFFIWPYDDLYYAVNPFKKIICEMTSPTSDPLRSLLVTDENVLFNLHQDIMEFIGDMYIAYKHISPFVESIKSGEIISFEDLFFAYVSDLMKNQLLLDLLSQFNSMVSDNYLIWQVDDDSDNIFMAVQANYKEVYELEFPDQTPLSGIKITNEEDFDWLLKDLTNFVAYVSETTAFNTIPFPPESRLFGDSYYSES